MHKISHLIDLSHGSLSDVMGLRFMHESSQQDMKRTTVSFEDEHFEILERWANREVRTVPNLITAIVVSVLRGEMPNPPEKIEDDKK